MLIDKHPLIALTAGRAIIVVLVNFASVAFPFLCARYVPALAARMPATCSRAALWRSKVASSDNEHLDEQTMRVGSAAVTINVAPSSEARRQSPPNNAASRGGAISAVGAHYFGALERDWS